MRRVNERNRRAALYGWIRYAPVLGLLFSVLFADTWLNTQTRNSDYELSRLNTELRELKARLDGVRAEQAGLQGVDRLVVAAPDLGLVTPEPNQVEVVYAGGPGFAPRGEGTLLLAAQAEPAEEALAAPFAAVASIYAAPAALPPFSDAVLAPMLPLPGAEPVADALDLDTSVELLLESL